MIWVMLAAPWLMDAAGLLQPLRRLARLRAEKVKRINELIADFGEREAEEAARAERRQHDLRALLGAVGLGHGIGVGEPGVEGLARAVGRRCLGGIFDTQLLAEIEHEGGEAIGNLAPAGEAGVPLAVGGKARD